MIDRTLLIGTRKSPLATWQANYVKNILTGAGYKAELRFISTRGDEVLDTPLPLMGGKGVFTKALDDALLSGDIDLAVHSLKDIPTQIPDGLMLGAISKRAESGDVLVLRKEGLKKNPAYGFNRFFSDFSSSGNDNETEGSWEGRFQEAHTQDVTKQEGWVSQEQQRIEASFLSDAASPMLIATSSNRRMGQWLARFPNHRITNIRGNIHTRLQKLYQSDWDGALFAASGLKRVGLGDHIHIPLPWMIPAPGQGALGVMIRNEKSSVRNAVLLVHDTGTALCTTIERDFLHLLGGGCSAPVAALATMERGEVTLFVCVVYPNGKGQILFKLSANREKAKALGEEAVNAAIKRGADTIIRKLKK